MRHTEKREKNPIHHQEIKQSTELYSKMTQMLKCPDRFFKNNYDEHIKGTSLNGGQHAKTDGKFEKRGRNYKKVKC